MCNELKMIALLEKLLELLWRNHGKNGHHFHISAIFFSCTLSDSRPTLTARLALAFTVEVCFQLKNTQTEPTGRTCSDSNLLAMQVFITVEEVTDRGATGRACVNNNPHSLQLGGICRVDIPAAGREFCDSDLQAVMHVSLAFLICHDHFHGSYMQ